MTEGDAEIRNEPANEYAAEARSGEAPTPSAPEPPPASRRKRRPGRGCLIALLAPLALAVLFAAYEAITWPRVGKLVRENPKTTSFIERYRAPQPRRERRVALGVLRQDLAPSEARRARIGGHQLLFPPGFDAEEMRQAVGEAWEDSRRRAERQP